MLLTAPSCVHDTEKNPFPQISYIPNPYRLWHDYGDMVSGETNSKREKRVKKPLNVANLRDLALSYAARYATTAAKLENYLIRKIRERGLEGTDEPVDIPAVVGGIVDRLVELKYVDDEAYAKARSGSLLRRGYGKRRVNEALRHAGVDEHTREEVAPNTAKAREAAITLARKRRFGPFGQDNTQQDDSEEETQPLDPAKRQKQIAAMLRAGHGFDTVRAIIDAGSIADVEEWLTEAVAEAASLTEEEHGAWRD